MALQIAFLKLILVSPLEICALWHMTHKITIGFNQIDLPQYSSYEMLRQQLLMAIHEGGEGFAFS